MTEDEVIKEITSIVLPKSRRGKQSILDYFMEHACQYPAELLLLNLPDDSLYKKYYYNFTEQILRTLQLGNFRDISEDKVDRSDLFFEAVSYEDDTSIPITAGEFAEKIVVYDDYRKLVTYDKSTKHYECFLVDINEEEAKKIIDDYMLHFDDLLEQDNIKNDAISQSMDFANACNVISNWLLEVGTVSEVRFINLGDEIKLDLVQSMTYKNGDKVSMDDFEIVDGNEDADDSMKPDGLD